MIYITGDCHGDYTRFNTKNFPEQNSMTKDDFVKYDGSQTWMDLRDCLTDEQMTVLEDKLLTTDDGRAIGIMADDLPVLKADNCYTSTDTEAAVGIIYNTPHKEEAVKYLLYLAGAME